MKICDSLALKFEIEKILLTEFVAMFLLQIISTRDPQDNNE